MVETWVAIFLWVQHTNGGGKCIPNAHKTYQMNLKCTKMAVKYSMWSLNISIFEIPIPSKIDRNWELWHEKITFGNPG
jgi:hypothetical protein